LTPVEFTTKEFAQFIGKELRPNKVEYSPKPEAVPILTFYRGKNTPERKDYMLDRLVVPVEEQGSASRLSLTRVF